MVFCFFPQNLLLHWLYLVNASSSKIRYQIKIRVGVYFRFLTLVVSIGFHAMEYLDRVPYFSYLTKTPFSLILWLWQLLSFLDTLAPLHLQTLLPPIFSFSTFDTIVVMVWYCTVEKGEKARKVKNSTH